jgi:hypothetical protein
MKTQAHAETREKRGYVGRKGTRILGYLATAAGSVGKSACRLVRALSGSRECGSRDVNIKRGELNISQRWLASSGLGNTLFREARR